MKKAMPLLTLLAYLVAIIVCIVNIFTGAEANLAAIIIFLAYVIGVMVLMFFFTKIFVWKRHKDNKKQEDEVPFEGLANTDETKEEKEDKDEETSEKTVSEVFAEEAVEEAAEETAEETVEEAAEDDSDDTEELGGPEVDVISTEGAEEAENEEENENIVVPVVVDTKDDEEEEADDDDDDDELDTSKFRKSRYTRTYASKLIQADDELKGYYSTIKNTFMSYKKVTCSVSREHERVRRGRTTIAIIKVRGKTILLYLALDPKQFENTMYVGENVSDVTKYESTPFLYRVNGPRKASRAARLISMLAEKMEMAPTSVPATEDYVARFPYESTAALVKKGLIIDNVAEAERKAEEARIAAEEAEKAAQKAIEEAIKAKEHADNVSERSERTIDEIETAEEEKAAKQ